MGRLFSPLTTWLLLAFWVAPAVSALGLGVMVIASSRVQTLQGAHQVGSLVILPIVLLLVALIKGVLLFAPARVAIMGALIRAMAGMIVRLGAGSLRRSRLAERI
jgi:ABC-2 type transport system permease protein